MWNFISVIGLVIGVFIGLVILFSLLVSYLEWREDWKEVKKKMEEYNYINRHNTYLIDNVYTFKFPKKCFYEDRFDIIKEINSIIVKDVKFTDEVLVCNVAMIHLIRNPFRKNEFMGDYDYRNPSESECFFYPGSSIVFYRDDTIEVGTILKFHNKEYYDKYKKVQSKKNIK